ncbi:MAG TPA: hypothetical protein VEC09_03955 [Actinomycetota bacterium]|nr:hypothetical protein [Actinomycetota bacterium]
MVAWCPPSATTITASATPTKASADGRSPCASPIPAGTIAVTIAIVGAAAFIGPIASAW